MNRQGRIVHFEEKPRPERLDELESEIPGHGRGCLASMGIYMFWREALEKAIGDPALVDFGRHVIPKAIGEMRVQAHFFRGYWEDVGTIGSYYEANLQLCDPMPPFDFYDVVHPVYTHPRFLPATKVEGCTLRNALVSEGCILMGAEIERSVIGIRSAHRPRHAHPQQPGARRRLLRDAGGDRPRAGARRCRPSASARDSRDRARDHRQERARRPRRADPERGGRAARSTATATTSATGS